MRKNLYLNDLSLNEPGTWQNSMEKPNNLGRHLLTDLLVINVMEIVFESGNIRLQNSNSRLRNVKQQKL
jgi:hypothetical protein